MRDLNVGRLSVRDWEGAGRPIVLLHGLASNLHIWDLVAPLLTGSFRVVAYDQRGHGESSDADDVSFEALCDDVDTVAEALGLENPVLAGHSWGASVALHYAATRSSCPGVVGVDGGVIDLQDMGLDWEQAAELLRPGELEGPADELLSRIRSEQSILPADAHERVVRRAFVVGADGVMRRRTPIPEHMRIVRALWEQRLLDVYRTVTCPVLLVLASGLDRDHREAGFVAVKREAARRLVERRPDVAVEWIASVHDVPLLHPAELADAIRRFATAL